MTTEFLSLRLLRYTVGLRDAVLFVTSLPMSPLAVPAAVKYEATSRTGREVANNVCFHVGREAIAADLIGWIQFIF
jgi:hypothetical protein